MSETIKAKNRVILNPIAGRGAGEKLAPQIVALLGDLGFDFELATSMAPGHARALARDAAVSGANAVIAVGGDGTSNEVLNGLLEVGAAPAIPALGVLPIGTGNDFAFGAGLSMDLETACQVVARGKSRPIDVGRMQAGEEEPLYFGNGVGMGFDAIANIESRKVKRLRGFPVYMIAVLRTLAFYYHAPVTTVRIDAHRFEQPSLMISVMNGRRLGGGFYPTPESRMDDGWLDLCMAAKVSRLRMVGFVPQLMRGTHTKDRKVIMARGRKVTVESDAPWAAHVDGEVYGVGARRFEIELFPRLLRLIS
jgi:YegS/Rv2252/BmrU family lipid kinase